MQNRIQVVHVFHWVTKAAMSGGARRRAAALLARPHCLEIYTSLRILDPERRLQVLRLPAPRHFLLIKFIVDKPVVNFASLITKGRGYERICAADVGLGSETYRYLRAREARHPASRTSAACESFAECFPHDVATSDGGWHRQKLHDLFMDGPTSTARSLWHWFYLYEAKIF